MGESELTGTRRSTFSGETALKAAAGEAARAWSAACGGALLIGLQGDLGSGKTTWARGMLEGLGHAGRVPSPTFTLLEHYPLAGLDVVHVDLYRLGDPGAPGEAGTDVSGELEALGLRDWLARERCWVLVEWPERAADLLRRLDLVIHLALTAEADAREVELRPRTARGAALVETLKGNAEPRSSKHS